MLKGLCEAYRAFNKPEFIELALQNASFITTSMINPEGRLNRIYKKDAPLSPAEGRAEAFLDDYANVIDAFMALYEVTFDEGWLLVARKLADSSHCSLL